MNRSRMQFYNAENLVYAVLMSVRHTSCFLARFRQSTRVALLMLLVFALKMGAVVACTVHDIADAKGGTEGISAIAAPVADLPSDPGNPFDVGGDCGHCGCHQSAAIVPGLVTAPSGHAQGQIAWEGSTSVSVPSPKELRPPIV